MAVTLVTGRPGSGKSYELVLYTIVAALREGRAVVANVLGLNVDLIRDYAAKNAPGQVGQLTVYDRADVGPDFFPSQPQPHVFVPSKFVPLGAVVVLDEAQDFFGSGSKPCAKHLDYLSFHRHVVDPATGVAADVVLAAHDPKNLQARVLRLCERHTRLKKQSSLGLSKTYAAHFFDGPNTNEKSALGFAVRRYDKSVFPLYASSTVAGSAEPLLDKRSVIWRRPSFIAVSVLVLGGLTFSALELPKLLHRVSGSAPAPAGSVVSHQSHAEGFFSSGPKVPKARAKSSPPSLLPSRYSIVGTERRDGVPLVLVRPVGAPSFDSELWPRRDCVVSDGVPMVCHVPNGPVAEWKP